MKTISVILPCYNEEASLPIYFKSVDPVIQDIDDYSFKFILVNDGSKDKTLEVMNSLYEERDDIEVVSLVHNFGQNPAIFAGLSVCDSDYAIVMDVDLQDPVELIKTIASKFKEGYDIVSPHRSNRQSDTFFKRTTAGMFYRFINKIEGKQVLPENVNNFRGISRKVIDAINALPNKDRFLINDIPLIGYKTCYIDFVRQKRSAGQSKYNIGKLFNYAFNLISAGTSKPLYLPIIVGAISTFLFFLAFIGLLITYCLMIATDLMHYNEMITTFFILSGVFLGISIIIFFIGIIGLYLHNILINTRNTPTFIIDIVKRQEDKKREAKESEDNI